MISPESRSYHNRNEQYTFRSNLLAGRHGWLRLTPAYGVQTVIERISKLPPRSVITDPFSGTGTTALVAAEFGHVGQGFDVNPFLVWLAKVKTTKFLPEDLAAMPLALDDVMEFARMHINEQSLWQPSIFQIEKWWLPGKLQALKALRHAIDFRGGNSSDIFDVALCRTLISSANVAFNHQSMSFKGETAQPTLFASSDFEETLHTFETEANKIIKAASTPISGSALVRQCDSRRLPADSTQSDLILTSPPYVNRMSYIRELRPYMYWLRYLDVARDAGELDWRAIGGTWGTATSKLNSWKPSTCTPVDSEMEVVCSAIRSDGGKNGNILATYVQKYHHDMWEHFKSVKSILKPGGRLSYIVGNSVFFKHEVPVHQWYAIMLEELGFNDIQVEIIRKRNSNKALYEFDVTAVHN